MRRLLTAAAGFALIAMAVPAHARTDDFTTTGGQNRWYNFTDDSPAVARPQRRGTTHRYRRQAGPRPHRRRAMGVPHGTTHRYRRQAGPRPHRRRAVRHAHGTRVTRSRHAMTVRRTAHGPAPFLRRGGGASRACLTRPARALLARIEGRFGPVQVISTCRPGARVAGTGRISRHASGNAIDFNAGPRKGAIVRWLIANHHSGGTMTYARMSHIHVDIGPRFVALNAGARYR